MWEHIKDILYFSRSEKNGIMVLLFLLGILIALPYASLLFISDEIEENKQFAEDIKIFTESLVEIEEPDYNNRLNQYIIERYDSIELFHFNPNKSSSKEFQQLGLTQKQIRTIVNYRKKGGKFDIKDDFRKIYGIRHKQYQILKPYILLPERTFRSKRKESVNNSYTNDSLFLFDPNTAGISELIRLGLSAKQANIVKNYRGKGGKFKSKEDFRKIYSISSDLHDRLEPYIFIKNKSKPYKRDDCKEEVSENLEIIELNKATIEELVKIKGIGNYTAKLIISYRDRLGGFIDINQLKEIRKLNNNNLEKYKSVLSVNKQLVKKISLNFSEIKDLLAHPYINYYQAKSIVEYRTKNGAYSDIKQLFDNKILLKNSYNKAKPYLKLN